jgi:hypothetical protein
VTVCSSCPNQKKEHKICDCVIPRCSYCLVPCEPLLAQSATAVWADADENLISSIWSGNDDKGSLFAPLYRGAFVGIEDLVYTPADGDYTKTRATVWVDWDSAANLGFPATKVSPFAV